MLNLQHLNVSLGLEDTFRCSFYGDFMKNIKALLKLTRFELCLWICSSFVVFISYFFSGDNGLVYTVASFIGVTALIYLAKGNVLGQILSVVFSIFYGIFSFVFGYYGETITYMFMTTPMAILAVISWLKNPYKIGEVKVAFLTKKEIIIMVMWTAFVTIAFFFILRALNTQNLIISTISITTSFFACYLTYKRSPFFALAYAANDIVLIILWVLASITDIKYLSIVACFTMFFFNDMYGFINWKRMEKRQNKKPN